MELKDSFIFTYNLVSEFVAYGYKLSSNIAFDIKEYVVDTIFPDPRIPGFIEEWKEKRNYYVKKEICSWQRK